MIITVKKRNLLGASMKHIFIYFTYLTLFSYQMVLLSQSDYSLFETFADKINLKIAKALLDEKIINSTQLTEGMTYEQFKVNLKYQENIKIAESINDEKLKLLKRQSQNSFNELAIEFINNSIALLPNQNDPTRKATIQKLQTESRQLLSSYSSQTNKSNDPIQNNPDELKLSNEEIEIDFYLWALTILTLVISITTSLLYLNNRKELSHLLKRFSDFEKDQQVIKQKNSEKPSSTLMVKKSDYLQIPDSEIDRIKNIIINHFELINREKEHLQSISIGEASTIVTLDENPSPRVDKIIVKYIEAPEKEGHFDKNFISINETPKSLYKIIIYPDSNKIEFDILINKISIHRNAMDLSNNLLKPACNYREDPKPYDKQIFKVTSEKGTLEEENGKLIIIDKLKIKFG